MYKKFLIILLFLFIPRLALADGECNIGLLAGSAEQCKCNVTGEVDILDCAVFKMDDNITAPEEMKIKFESLSICDEFTCANPIEFANANGSEFDIASVATGGQVGEFSANLLNAENARGKTFSHIRIKMSNFSFRGSAELTLDDTTTKTCFTTGGQVSNGSGIIQQGSFQSGDIGTMKTDFTDFGIEPANEFNGYITQIDTNNIFWTMPILKSNVSLANYLAASFQGNGIVAGNAGDFIDTFDWPVDTDPRFQISVSAKNMLRAEIIDVNGLNNIFIDRAAGSSTPCFFATDPPSLTVRIVE
jgi:hypothetical protein